MPQRRDMKGKLVIIDGMLVFNGQANYIKNIQTGVRADLTVIMSELLFFLLSNENDISTRDEILEFVFERNGARPTESNLNLNISMLRKSLSSVGFEKNLIITVPKKGFKLAESSVRFKERTNVTPDKNGVTKAGVVTTSQKRQNNYPYSIFLIASVFIFLFSILYFYSSPDFELGSKIESENLILVNECKIHIIGSDDQSSKLEQPYPDYINKAVKNDNCSLAKDVYIFNYKNKEDQLQRYFYGICGIRDGYYRCASHFELKG